MQHRKPRYPLARNLVGIGVTAIASVGVFVASAFVALSNNSMTGPSSAPPEQAAYAAPSPTYSKAPLRLVVPVLAQVRAKVANVAFTSPYRVRPGDTLTGIAQSKYHRPEAWTVLYWKNHHTIKYANIIDVGQVLTIPALPSHIPAAPAVLAPPAPPAPVHITVAAAVQSTSGDESDGSQQPQQSSAPAPSGGSSTASTGGYSVGSSFQACVIQRESGGNSQIWNGSGHYGLYQFSASTWAAVGGDPNLFGHADAAYQTKVFWMAVALDGVSDWRPYDGC